MNRRFGIILEIIALIVLILPVVSSTAYSNARAAEDSSFPWPMYLPSIVNNGVITESCIVGEWLRLYDWSCDGQSFSITDQIKADHTWSASSGSTGTWELNGANFSYYYSSGTAYTGKVDSTCTSMSGTMISFNGLTGCWTSNKTASGNRSGVSENADEKEASSILNDFDDDGMPR